jgi:hypothetical protein
MLFSLIKPFISGCMHVCCDYLLYVNSWVKRLSFVDVFHVKICWSMLSNSFYNKQLINLFSNN